MKKFYKVTAKCGHVGGIKKYILIDFYTTAPDGKTAAANVRTAGRVQHDKKDAIQDVREISREEYVLGLAAYNADPYTRCHNPQEQALYWDEIAPRVQTEKITEFRKDKPRNANPKRSRRYGYDGSEADLRRYCRELCA